MNSMTQFLSEDQIEPLGDGFAQHSGQEQPSIVMCVGGGRIAEAPFRSASPHDADSCPLLLSGLARITDDHAGLEGRAAH